MLPPILNESDLRKFYNKPVRVLSEDLLLVGTLQTQEDEPQAALNMLLRVHNMLMIKQVTPDD